MSQTASHTLAYTSRDEAADRLPALRLTLEPERVGERANRATLADIDVMLALAASGASARNRQASRCGWARWTDTGDLVVTLALWVWPSAIDLEYALTMPEGVESAPPVLERRERDVKYWIAGSGGEIEMPWSLEDATFEWHQRIGVWDESCRPADPPEIRQDRARLMLSGGGERYGVLHVRGTSLGWRHDISIRYPKGDDPAGSGAVRIEADSFEVRANWTDETGERREESARMELPSCVREMLSLCPEGTLRGGSPRMEPEGPVPPVVVYYNSCNGRVLDTRRGGR